jgi:hypothetical protein
MHDGFFWLFWQKCRVSFSYLFSVAKLYMFFRMTVLLGRSAVTAAGPVLPSPLFRSRQFHFLWYIFRDGILKRLFWTKFLGINSSLLRPEFLSCFPYTFFC